MSMHLYCVVTTHLDIFRTPTQLSQSGYPVGQRLLDAINRVPTELQERGSEVLSG
ncbi:MAG TPA: hypothetical protein VFU49_18195 [Ktedonobacteraceae bacterium]|nr:hypothetical protein [Ktedonobacteraceae bacterium]